MAQCQRRRRPATAIFCLALAVTLGWGCGGSPDTPDTEGTAATSAVQGIPHDWSHRHLIFSQPSSAAAMRQLERDPRYRIQQAWRASQSGPASSEAQMRALDALAVQLGSASKPPAGPHEWGHPIWGHPKRIFPGDWTTSLGFSAKVGPNMYPAKYSFDPIGTPNCTSDFVVFNTGKQASNQASIIAYNNLYAGSTSTGGCGTSGVPAVYWAYNTGAPIVTSVVLSADGTQVAFVQTAGGAASLGLLKWAASTSESITSPVTPTAVTNSAYRTCSAACMTTIPFVNEFSDTDSSPFYDYTNDIIYVGDDDEYLHKFTGVFKGSPSEVTNSSTPWATVVTGAMLTSPVLDSGASPPLVFVASVYTASVGGKLSAVNTSTASPVTSALIGHNIDYDIADAPVVDSTAGYVYVAVSNDNNSHSGVFLFNRTFAAATSGSEAAIGTAASSTMPPVYDGDFDNTYYNSSNATGNLYICGEAGGEPTLYQVHISAGTFPSGNVKTGPTLASTAGTACSPVTEIYNANATNGPFDWIFLSVEGSGSMTPCNSGGCVMNFIVTAWQASSAYLLKRRSSIAT